MSMLCENCKENIATVFIEQIADGQKTEVHLCQECSMTFHAPLFLETLLKGLILGSMPKAETPPEKDLECVCGMRLSELRKKGKLGCATCYVTFKRELTSIFKNIQWSMEHTGKLPEKNAKGLLRKREIKQLREELRLAVEAEAYEEAAQLRDEIKALERGQADEVV